ncbi:SDR family NAD(P)-dependent oxidoreductase [Streptomyces sp. NPDC046985]|uniref:SDR family NAD(P)-dependent oxidoreductase n=1 Tax=Streptomyces sp. NPDC046985 TaxID=3155377 RepID=UPI0033C6C183
MSVSSVIDTVLDRSIVLGYGWPGLFVRRLLPGWPAGPQRMDGKVVLVTGAGSGIGLAAAVGFARLGASVRVLGRTEHRAEEAATLTRERAGATADVRPVVCDVSSLTALREFADRFRRQEERLDVLVNNAGVMPDEREESADGVELTFATHVLAPWVLIEELTPLLERSAPSLVVNVTSGGQYGQQLPAGDPESRQTSYSPKKIYARTKRAQVVLTEQWADRLRDRGVHVHSMHPGWADTKGVRQWMPVFRALSRPIIRTSAEGADTIVWLGSAPEAVRSTGLFWHDRRPRPTTYAVGAEADAPETREELWQYVAALAGDEDEPTPLL